MKKADMEYMQRAIELATQARGRTSPNPMVGAVIVKDGKIIGRDIIKGGYSHAEIHAPAAGNEAREQLFMYHWNHAVIMVEPSLY